MSDIKKCIKCGARDRYPSGNCRQCKRKYRKNPNGYDFIGELPKNVKMPTRTDFVRDCKISYYFSNKEVEKNLIITDERIKNLFFKIHLCGVVW